MRVQGDREPGSGHEDERGKKRLSIQGEDGTRKMMREDETGTRETRDGETDEGGETPPVRWPQGSCRPLALRARAEPRM